MGCLRRMRELGMGRPCGAREIEDARAVARCTGNTGAWNAAADEAIATSAAARMAHLVAAIRSWESPVCNFFDTDQFKFKWVPGRERQSLQIDTFKVVAPNTIKKSRACCFCFSR